MRILRIVLFSVLFWALFEGSETPEVSYCQPADALTVLAGGHPDCGEPDCGEPVSVTSCGQLRWLLPNILPPVRTVGPELSVRHVPAYRGEHPACRPAGARMGGDWCAPVKNRNRFSCSADAAPVRRYILRLRRLLI